MSRVSTLIVLTLLTGGAFLLFMGIFNLKPSGVMKVLHRYMQGETDGKA